MKSLSFSMLACASVIPIVINFSDAKAQVVADPRNNAQEQTFQHSQEDLELIENQARRLRKEQERDQKEAAKSLQTNKKTGGVLSKLPSEENLARLRQLIQKEPNNLDHYFAYAQMASRLGKHEIAAQTYALMLEKAPQLHRVRLDLGAAYLLLGRYEDAKRELETVLASSPPDQVRANVENVLRKVNYELVEHDISGSVTVGVNLDSNGNSAPESNTIIINDTEILLDATQREQQDLQFFTALGVNHTYRPKWAQSEHFARRWKTSVNAYRAEQSSLEELDLQVYSITTGPEFQSKKSGIKVSPSVSRSQIVLDEHTYLRTTSFENRIDYPVTQKLGLSGHSRIEFREFENAPTVTVFELRTGTATQHQLSANYALTPKDYLNVTATHRRERTREEFFDNKQLGANVSYTRVLPFDSIANVSIGYRNMVYDGPDPLISTKTRHDKERTFGINLNKKLSNTVSANIGYQYRDMDSNIQNYEFENHRYTTSLNYRF